MHKILEYQMELIRVIWLDGGHPLIGQKWETIYVSRGTKGALSALNKTKILIYSSKINYWF